MSLLETVAISKRFAGIAALNDIELTVDVGESVGLIGPNGAGKTTFFNCILGMLRPDAFYGSVFGWSGVDAEVVGQLCHILLSEGAQQFILLAEGKKPLQSPGYDHLGLLFSTRAEVDEKLEQCKRYQEKDDRVQIKEYDDLVTGDLTTRAFYVKYLLPIYFDVQCLERAGEPIANELT